MGCRGKELIGLKSVYHYMSERSGISLQQARLAYYAMCEMMRDCMIRGMGFKLDGVGTLYVDEHTLVLSYSPDYPQNYNHPDRRPLTRIEIPDVRRVNFKLCKKFKYNLNPDIYEIYYYNTRYDCRVKKQVIAEAYEKALAETKSK